MLDILCSTLGDRLPQGLEHVPQPAIFRADTRPGWAAASNALLDQACEAGHDALFLDDDIILLPETFKDMEQWLPLADVIGFRLLSSGRTISAGHYLHGIGALLPNDEPDVSSYLAHVTASAMYIKHAVLAAGVRFPEWPGVHGEDVAFTYDVWLHGFKVLYWPAPVEHEVAPNGIGATKAHLPNLGHQLGVNNQLLDQWVAERGVIRAAWEEKIPIGRWEINQEVLTHGR